jgi:recombination protein RecT
MANETALAKINTLQTAMNEDYVQSQLKAALGDNSAPFAASLIDLFTGDNNLQECNPKMVIMQAMKAAILKLPINKSLGFAYLIAYGGKVEMQLGYKGIYQLALRTAQYKVINVDVIYEGELKTVNKLTGECDLSGMATSANVIGYFAHFELLNGFAKTLFMTKDKVTAHAKKFSKTFDKGPWKTDFDAMAKKTVLKYLLSHFGQLSVEMANILDKEDEADKLQTEIGEHANKKNMHFSGTEDAEIVPMNNGNQQQAAQSQQADKAPF